MPPQRCAAWLTSSRAPSDVMMIGTLCFSQSARSCSRRLFDRCTIWLTANGADGRSGWAASYSPRSCLMRISPSSSNSGGRAFSAGNAPTMPALHWAITRSGTETMNSGAPIAGSDRRPLNKAGIDIGKILVFRATENPSSGQKDARHHLKKAIALSQNNAALLAQCAGDEIIGPAVVRLARPARDQHFCRTGFHRIRRQAFAFLEALGLTELVGCRLAIGCAVGRHRTFDAALGHGRRRGEARQALTPILGRVFGAGVEIVECLSCAFQRRQDRQGFFQPLAHFVEQARIFRSRRRGRSSIWRRAPRLRV